MLTKAMPAGAMPAEPMAQAMLTETMAGAMPAEALINLFVDKVTLGLSSWAKSSFVFASSAVFMLWSCVVRCAIALADANTRASRLKRQPDVFCFGGNIAHSIRALVSEGLFCVTLSECVTYICTGIYICIYTHIHMHIHMHMHMHI